MIILIYLTYCVGYLNFSLTHKLSFNKRFHCSLNIFEINLSQYSNLLKKSSAVIIAYLTFLLKNTQDKKEANSFLSISQIKNISSNDFVSVVSFD
jgi:hypothetical protein